MECITIQKEGLLSLCVHNFTVILYHPVLLLDKKSLSCPDKSSFKIQTKLMHFVFVTHIIYSLPPHNTHAVLHAMQVHNYVLDLVIVYKSYFMLQQFIGISYFINWIVCSNPSS